MCARGRRKSVEVFVSREGDDGAQRGTHEPSEKQRKGTQRGHWHDTNARNSNTHRPWGPIFVPSARTRFTMRSLTQPPKSAPQLPPATPNRGKKGKSDEQATPPPPPTPSLPQCDSSHEGSCRTTHSRSIPMRGIHSMNTA